VHVEYFPMHPGDEESTLWAEFKKGDKRAYEVLYRRYAPLMYNYGFKFTQSADLTRDAVQEVFTELLWKSSRLGLPFSVKHYLYKALRHEIFRQVRAASRLAPETEIQEACFDAEFTVEQSMIQEELTTNRQEALLGAVNSLPRRQKEVIFLRYYDGLTYDEIADIMGIEQSSVYKITYKALESLWTRLKQQAKNMTLSFFWTVFFF
jgi:RNA polymerase sigma factor (sigma-70 family)